MSSKQAIYFGADHGGYALKDELKRRLADDYAVVDMGNEALEPLDDYPLFGLLAAGRILDDARRGVPTLGVLLCRSAEGMIITANKVAGIRAAVATDAAGARLARQHNAANILALPGDHLDSETAEAVCREFFAASPSKDSRHVRRRQEIARIEAPHLEIVPGIFEAERQAVMGRLAALADIADAAHLDLADGVLVPAAALADPTDATGLDLPEFAEVHLMVERPERFVQPWFDAGARRLIAHVEAPGFADFVEAAKRAEAEVVGALDLGSDPRLLEEYIPRLDGVLLMTVKAGRSGQRLDPRALQMMADLAAQYPDLRLEADGGVHLATVPAIAAAGATLAVATSALGESSDPATALEELETLWRHYHA